MNTRMLKRISCWVISSLLCLAFMGQTTLGEEKPDTSPTILKVCSLPFLSFAPIFIAIEEGYFAEQGLKIEMIKFRSGPDALPALTQGQIDVLAGAISASFFNAVARGLDIKLVADKGHLELGDKSAAAVVRKDLYKSGELRSLHDLKRKRVSLIYPSSMTHYRIDILLACHKLSSEDIEIVYLGWPATVQALKTGAIDVAFLGEPSITRVLSEGFGVILSYHGDLYQYLFSASQVAGIFFGPNLLKDHPDLGRRFVLAYLKGVRAYNRGKIPRNVEIISRHTKLDRELLIECNWPRIYSDGHLDIQSILSFQNWLQQNGFIDQEVSPNEIVDTSFIDWANNELSKSD